MSNWLDLSNNANTLKSTYLKGFLDLSGGSIRTRNATDHLVIAGDVSFSNNLFVHNDVSLSNDLYVKNTLQVQGDSSLNSNLFVSLDTSLNKSLYVKENLLVEGNANLNDKILLGGDVSFTGNIVPTAGNTYSLGSADAPLSAVYVFQSSVHFMDANNNDTTLSIDEAEGTLDIDVKDSAGVSEGGRKKVLYAVNKNVGIGKRSRVADATLDLSGTMIVSKDVSFNDRLFVQNDVSLNNNLYVGGST